MTRWNLGLAMLCAIAVGCDSKTESAVDAGTGTGPTLELIDDLEDGNLTVLAAGTPTRTGLWTTYSDKGAASPNARIIPKPTSENGVFASEAGGHAGSAWAAHVQGGDCIDYGCGTNLFLMNPNNATDYVSYSQPDAKGISFWARLGSTAGASPTLTVRVFDVNNTPDVDNPCITHPKGCYDAFKTTITLTSEWKQYELLFAKDFAQEGWGMPAAAVEVAKLYYFDWNTKNAAFDYWLDDVAFIKGGAESTTGGPADGPASKCKSYVDTVAIAGLNEALGTAAKTQFPLAFYNQGGLRTLDGLACTAASGGTEPTGAAWISCWE